MSTSQGGTVIGYPTGALQVVAGNLHPTDERTDLKRLLVRRILPIVLGLMLVFVFCFVFLWAVPAIQLGYPNFEQVESATVTTRLNATVSEWNITLYANYPKHHKITIKDLHAVALYKNHRLRFDTSPESFVMNHNQTLLNMKLTTGNLKWTTDDDDVGKEVDNDKRSMGKMSFALRMSGCVHLESSPWMSDCFIVVCSPITLGFNDNGTATMSKHAQCGWGKGKLVE